jgi:TonB-linked SusC/RagA family outer membrane protein
MRKMLSLMFLNIGMFLLCTSGHAQELLVKGRVTGPNLEPLQGVTVTVKSTNRSATTDASGSYSIRANRGNVLVFTSIGFQRQELTLSGESADVQLLTDSRSLENVVVTTALGIQKTKRSLGYSTQEIKGEEIAQTQRDNFLNALQGRVAGATINSTSGAPGASVQVVLRGVNSLSGNNSPLIIVDGLPVNNNSFDQHLLASNLDNRNNDYTNRAADINPDDIESVNILKGPEATALYGIQAGSGAIVITTKRARTGKLRVGYDNSFTTTHVYRFPEVQNVYDNGFNGQAPVISTGDRRLLGPRYAPGTALYDNIKKFFRDGFAQKHTLSLEGGMGNTAMRGSLTYRDEKGVIPNTGLNIVSGRFSISNKPSSRLDLNSSISYTYSKNDKAFRGGGGFLQELMLWPLDDDAKNWMNPNGTRRKVLPPTSSGGTQAELDNPFFDVYRNHSYDRTHRATANFSAVYDITSWWNLTARVGTDFYTQFGNSYLHPESNSAYSVGGQVEEYNEQYLSLNGVFLTTFKKNVGKLKNTLRLGVSNDDWVRKDFSIVGTKLRDSVTRDLTVATVFSNSRLNGIDTLTKKRLQGVFGELNLNYNDIVYVNVTGRNDWTSTLPLQSRSFFYPSVSTAFIFSDLIAKNAHGLSFGKLRASYAQTAKDILPYGSQSWYTNATGQGQGYGWVYDFYNNNPLIKPERQKTFEVGTELRFLDNRIGIDAAYYDTRNIGQIVRLVRLSYATGFVLNTSNIADTKNTGVEISLNVQPVKNNNFTWTTIFNFSKTQNKITSLPNNIPEFYNSDTWLANFRAGLTRNGTITQITGTDYLRNNKGQIMIDPASGFPLTNPDYVKIGERNPDFLLGIVNNFSFKRRFNLSFLLDIRKGGDILNGNEIWMVQNGLSKRTLDRETPRIIPGILKDGLENTANPTVNTISIVPMYQSLFYTANTLASDYVEHNVNWLRLRDITLRYSFGQSMLRRLRVFSSADVFVTGTDLFLITNYSGVDPTAAGNSAATSGAGSFGIDYGSLSTPRGINFGIRVQFANK